MGFSRQKYWSGLPCPPPGDFYAIADGASDILKGRGGKWRGFDPAEAEKKAEASLFAFFGLNTG